MSDPPLVKAVSTLQREARFLLVAASKVHHAVRVGYREDAAEMAPHLERLFADIASFSGKPEPVGAQDITNQAVELLQSMTDDDSRTLHAIQYARGMAHELFGGNLQFTTGQALPDRYLRTALASLRGPAGDWLLADDNPPLSIDAERGPMDAECRKAKGFARMSTAERLIALEAWRGPTSTIGKETLAIAALFKDQCKSVAEVAENIGVDRKSLYRMKKFRHVAEEAGILKPRGAKSPLRRGHKTADGDIEAYVEGEDE